MIPARMSLHSIVQYVSVESKLNSQNEAHIKDRHRHPNGERRDDRNVRQLKEDPTVSRHPSQSPGSKDGKSASSGEHMTREDHEDAHFLAFLAHNTKVSGNDKARWRKASARQGKELRGIGNPPFTFTEYQWEHGGCRVCYGKGRSHKHDRKTCKVYKQVKRAYFQTHPKSSSKRSGLMNGKRDKLMEVDMRNQATAVIGEFGELMRLSSR